MKRVLRDLRDAYIRITDDTPLPLTLFTDRDSAAIMLWLAVIALCLSISTGLMYLLVQGMGTHPPVVLYPLALIVNVLYTLGGMALLVVLLVGGLLLSLWAMYWMIMVPLTVGVYLWSLVPSNKNHVRRK